MGLKEFINLTQGKMAVMLLFVLGSLIPSSIGNFPNLQFDIVSQLQLILLLPWFLLNMAAMCIYSTKVAIQGR